MSKYAWIGMWAGFIVVWYVLKMDALVPGILGGFVGAAVGEAVGFIEKRLKK